MHFVGSMLVNMVTMWVQVIFTFLLAVPGSSMFNINTQTCETKYDLEYKLVELNCKWKGVGMYVVDLKQSVKTIRIDRLKSKTWIYVPNHHDDVHIDIIRVDKGSMDMCKQILADNVEIWINGQQCISTVNR